MKTQSLRARLRESTWVAIVDAAEAVGSRGGPSAMTLQAIAQEAGIAVGTIYNYFADRNELIGALFARRREELAAVLEATAKTHASEKFEAQLDAYVRTVLGYFDEHRAYLRLALEAADQHDPALARVSKDGKKVPAGIQMQLHAERVIKVGAKEKRLRTEGAHLFSAALVALLKAVLVTCAATEGTLESETASVVSIFLHGVAR